MSDRPTSLVVMGVSGSGKTTIAQALSARLGWEYGEGDDHHPPANVAKMSAGIPLDDDDRRPWLGELRDWISERESRGGSSVLTCSALKRAYRDILRDGNESVWFVHVHVPQDLLMERMTTRTGHYMPASLLVSQLSTLEPLAEDEAGVTVPGVGDQDEVLDLVLTALAEKRGIDVPQSWCG